MTNPGHPDMVRIDALAEHLGVSVDLVMTACIALQIDVEAGVQQSFVDPIRQVVLQWLREGRNL